MKIVFDLDGTICFQGKPVSQAILESLVGLERQGHEVIFASARPIRDLLPVLHERFHQFQMIGGNGAIVAKGGRIQQTTSFDDETLSTIKKIINLYDVTYLIDSDWDYTYTGSNDHPILQNLDPQGRANHVHLSELKTIIKVLILSSTNMSEVKSLLMDLDVVVHEHKNENIIDISPKGIDKWSGLQKLGVRDGNFIAFGNDANDISMFQHAKHSVMIGEHADLTPFASERLPLTEYVETSIIKKLAELGEKYAI